MCDTFGNASQWWGCLKTVPVISALGQPFLLSLCMQEIPLNFTWVLSPEAQMFLTFSGGILEVILVLAWGTTAGFFHSSVLIFLLFFFPGVGLSVLSHFPLFFFFPYGLFYYYYIIIIIFNFPYSIFCLFLHCSLQCSMSIVNSISPPSASLFLCTYPHLAYAQGHSIQLRSWIWNT